MGVLATDLDTVATDTYTVLTTTTDTTAWATMVLDTVPTDTVLDTTDTPVLATTDTVLATTARGPLSPPPSPPLTLMLRLIPTTDTTAMDTDTVSDTTVLDTAPTDTVLATTATAMVCTDTTDKCPAIHPKTSLGITSSSSEKWIAQFGLTPTSATSFSATRLAQARNGEQEAKENQNVMIRRIKKLKSTIKKKKKKKKNKNSQKKKKKKKKKK